MGKERDRLIRSHGLEPMKEGDMEAIRKYRMEQIKKGNYPPDALAVVARSFPRKVYKGKKE